MFHFSILHMLPQLPPKISKDFLFGPIIDFNYYSDAQTQTDIDENTQGPVDLSTIPTTTMNFSPGKVININIYITL